MSHLIFVRHGESEMNAAHKHRKIFNGQFETPLTSKGRDQAIETGKMLASKAELQIGLAVSSTIGRSVDTARLALAQFPREVPLLFSDGFRERSLGIFENRYQDEVQVEYPEYFENPALKHFRMHFLQKAPGGENLTMVTDRGWEAVRQYEAQCTHDLAVFSHATIIRCLVGKALALSPEEIVTLDIPNAEPIVLRKTGETYELISGLPL